MKENGRRSSTGRQRCEQPGATDLLAPEPLLHYLRYNVRLEADELCEMGLGDCGERVADFYDLDSAEQRHDMLRIGRAAARCQITPEHFPASFDLR